MSDCAPRDEPVDRIPKRRERARERIADGRSCLAVASFGLARPELAAAPERGDGNDARPTRSWYGWQVLLADGAATGFFATAAATGSRPVFTTGLISYALAAPAVHILHGRTLPGVGSLGLRIALPSLFGLVGYGSVSCRSDYADEAEGVACTDERRTRGTLGLAAGAAIATGLDVALMAFELRRPSPPSRGVLKPQDVAVLPLAGPDVLGIAARATF